MGKLLTFIDVVKDTDRFVDTVIKTECRLGPIQTFCVKNFVFYPCSIFAVSAQFGLFDSYLADKSLEENPLPDVSKECSPSILNHREEVRKRIDGIDC